MACATSSLPVPLSPVTSTGESVKATCSTRRSTSSHSGESPLMRNGRPSLARGPVELRAAQELGGRGGERLQLGDVRGAEGVALARRDAEHADGAALIGDGHGGDRAHVEEVGRVVRVARGVVDQVGLVGAGRRAWRRRSGGRRRARCTSASGIVDHQPLDDVEARRARPRRLASHRKMAPLRAPVRSSARSMMRRSSCSDRGGVQRASASLSLLIEMLR